jgi:hypothetical protein
MNYSFLAIPLMVILALSALADDQPTTGSTPAYKPRLSGMMSATQFLHYKVWYADKTQNWPLADYEMKRLKDNLQDVVTFYPGLAQADMSMMEKAAAQVDTIKTKDTSAFVNAFVQLTAACNSCHRSQGYGFIVIRLPTASLHRNQIFIPQ